MERALTFLICMEKAILHDHVVSEQKKLLASHCLQSQKKHLYTIARRKQKAMGGETKDWTTKLKDFLKAWVEGPQFLYTASNPEIVSPLFPSFPCLLLPYNFFWNAIDKGILFFGMSLIVAEDANNLLCNTEHDHQSDRQSVHDDSWSMISRLLAPRHKRIKLDSVRSNTSPPEIMEKNFNPIDASNFCTNKNVEISIEQKQEKEVEAGIQVTTVQLQYLTFTIAAQNINMTSVLAVVKKFESEAFLDVMVLFANTRIEVPIISMVETLYQNLIFKKHITIRLRTQLFGKLTLMEVLLVLQRKWMVVAIAYWSLKASFQWSGFENWKLRLFK
ncbi:hypothetical protein V6N13_148113 [Hibiscus sabdariffa]|uniref:Uncharacterized protein n=1 Tax=Hibiscus sabdariffa TaxID=183260 RepID=A0ABR2TXJ3_9ROSI